MTSEIRDELLRALPTVTDVIPSLSRESVNSQCGPCPVCGGSDRFVWREDKQRFLCRGCHPEQGGLIDFHMWLDGLTFKDLCSKYGINSNKPSKPLHPALQWLVDTRKINHLIVSKHNDAGRIWGQSYKDKPAVGVLYVGLEGKHHGKAVKQFILADGSGKFFKKDCPASGNFFFFAGADPVKADIIILVESVIDALSLECVNPSWSAVAIGSSTYTRKIEQLRPFKEKVVLFFDRDKPGQTVTNKAIQILGNPRVVDWESSSSKHRDVNDFLKSGDTNLIKDMVLQSKVIKAQNSIADNDSSIQDNSDITTIWDNPINLENLFDKEPEPVKWFGRDRLLVGRGVLITGIGGSSKTRLLYHLAVGAAIKRLSWDWEISTLGRTVLVLTEDTQDDVHRTLHHLCLSLELSETEKLAVYDSIVAYPLAGKDATLLRKTSTGTLEKTDLFLSLADKIKKLGDVVFVGLDPALSFTEGDEMDQGNQRALGKMVDDLGVQTGACCCLVTHATKASLQKEELGSHNSRGGGAITDAVRAEYAMRTMTPEEAIKAGITDVEERKRHVQLVATKGNLLPPGAYVPVWLRRDDFGMLHQADINLDGTTPCKRDIDALEILQSLSKYSTPPLKEWRSACMDAGIITGKGDTAKKNMQRTLNKLKKAGLIEPGHGRGIYIPTLSKEGT